jgi:hypothetical protein
VGPSVVRHPNPICVYDLLHSGRHAIDQLVDGALLHLPPCLDDGCTPGAAGLGLHPLQLPLQHPPHVLDDVEIP